jgi:hypothetical protein
MGQRISKGTMNFILGMGDLISALPNTVLRSSIGLLSAPGNPKKKEKNYKNGKWPE